MPDTSSGAGEPLGLYLHVPFCVSLCSYCDFTRNLAVPDLMSRYVRALAREIRSGVEAGGPRPAADTVYVGGGTPTVLDPHEVARLIETCRSVFSVADDAEITLEANPESVDPVRLRSFRRAGVNRLSLGVQSFADPELARLGRAHSASRAREAVLEARAAGFGNVSLDLMMGLPDQTMTDWLASIDALVALEPEHASLYILELHEHTPVWEEIRRGRRALPNEDTVAEMYLHGMERLEVAGYRQYEISNLARPGCTSRHNLKYWTDGEWIGFGCGAHSTLNGVRWNNVTDLRQYVTRCETGEDPAAARQVLSRRRRFEDAIVMGLRLSEGVDVTAIERRYGVEVWRAYGARLAPFVSAGLLDPERARLRLTRPGMLLSNEVMRTFVDIDSTIQ